MCLSSEDKQCGHVWRLRSVTPITELEHCTRTKSSPQPGPRFLISLVKYTDLRLGVTSGNKNGMTNKMIRKEFRWRGLPFLFALPLCPQFGISLGPGGLREESRSSSGGS